MSTGSRSAISLFSGAGGLDLGVTQAGFDIAVALDSDKTALQTHARNLGGRCGTTYLREDILDLEPGDVRRAAGLAKGAGLDLLIGGPPCTPFSKSAYWLDWKRQGLDPAHGLVGVFARYVEALLPRFVIFENVPALASPRGAYRGTYLEFIARLEQAGYSVWADVLNAAEYGVAQNRHRLFVVAAQSGASNAIPGRPDPTLGPAVSCATAFEGLPDDPEPEELLSGKWANLLPDVPPGENYLVFTARRGHSTPLFEWRSRYWSFLLKLDPDRPAPTIQARPGPSTGPFHWENRRLRVRELKRLFGYPDDFRFAGSRRQVQIQIGNSVPPPVGLALARSLSDVPRSLL